MHCNVMSVLGGPRSAIPLRSDTMHCNVMSVLVCGAAVFSLLSSCGLCAGGEPNDGVKLLYGFELAEILGDRPTDLSAC